MSRPKQDILQGTLDMLILQTLALEPEWNASENNRQAKYYHLTRTGRRQLSQDAAHDLRAARNEVVLAHVLGSGRSALTIASTNPSTLTPEERANDCLPAAEATTASSVWAK